jgi:hypothetical protein
MTRSYSDLSDSATTFDPEEQFDRDIDERMKGMSKEEAVAKAIQLIECGVPWERINPRWRSDYLEFARAAITAADKWDAEQGKTAGQRLIQSAQDASKKLRAQSTISPGLDSAIQAEEDHGPASIMKED